VRIAGRVSRVDRRETEDYFCSRPRGSQLAAWASAQSEEIEDRNVLEAALADAEARFEGGPVPAPAHWGGYVLAPRVIEFWQGRPSRLHDRLVYTKQADDAWTIQRLSP
jgi:pyridoxamine 5'-phosphate oxidase